MAAGIDRTGARAAASAGGIAHLVGIGVDGGLRDRHGQLVAVAVQDAAALGGQVTACSHSDPPAARYWAESTPWMTTSLMPDGGEGGGDQEQQDKRPEPAGRAETPPGGRRPGRRARRCVRVEPSVATPAGRGASAPAGGRPRCGGRRVMGCPPAAL